MSEQPTARPPAGKKGPLGLSRTQWIIVGVAFAGALGYILWKRHTASTAAATSTQATTSANGQGSGLSAGALTSLQDELDSLLGGGAGGGSAGGGGTTGTVGGTSTAGTTTTTTAPTSTKTTTSTSGGGTAAPKAGPISNLQATTTKTTIRASWNKAANATSYQLIITDLSKNQVVQRPKTTGTSITISGLKSGTDYNVGIQGLPGGPGDNIHAKTL